MVVGYMQATMALISPSSRFFNKSFFKNAAWISLWDLRAWRQVGYWCNSLECSVIRYSVWKWKLKYLLILIESCGKQLGEPWTSERQIFQLEQVGAEGTLCALTPGFCHSFSVKPWQESPGPDWMAQKWLSSSWPSAGPQIELSKLQDNKTHTSHHFSLGLGPVCCLLMV